MKKKTILQITGQPGAGKTEMSKHLVDRYGFTSILVSDLIRDYARPRGISLKERQDYITATVQMLAELGQYAIPDTIMRTPENLICVDGIRIPAHVKKLQEHGSKIIALDCPSAVRYERALLRKGELDKTSFKDFVRDEELESQNADPFVQNTRTVMKMADYRIDSSRPIAQVLQKVSGIVSLLIAAKR